MNQQIQSKEEGKSLLSCQQHHKGNKATPGQVSHSSGPFKFNAHAPEFVPSRSTNANSHGEISFPGGATDGSYFYHPYLQFLDASSPALHHHHPDQHQQHLFYFPHDHHDMFLFSPDSSNLSVPNSSSTAAALLPVDDLKQKIMKQVEYLFSDLSLLANDTMAKHVSKDPEGYVPLAAIASMKKIKALANNDYYLLVQALRSSSKLVLSPDGKKVKRRIPFTEHYKDDLQCRTVVAENLPDDHSYQNLEKVFGAVGSVKAIRLCHPREANASRSKSDLVICNKVENLNDERDWRKGLRVRLLLRCSPKSVLKNKKSEFDVFVDDDEVASPESFEDLLHANIGDLVGDSNVEENPGSAKKILGCGRGKAKGRGQVHNMRGLLGSPAAQPGSPIQFDLLAKQARRGPRMPDGTRGFTMGRGKPLVAVVTSQVQ
ncbi:La-related protein [Drosera capensis]